MCVSIAYLNELDTKLLKLIVIEEPNYVKFNLIQQTEN